MGKQPPSTKSNSCHLTRARTAVILWGGVVRVSTASFLALSYLEVAGCFVNILLILQLGFLFIHLI